MTDERLYSRAEVDALLTAALAEAEPAPEQYTMNEVLEAASSAGIDEQRVVHAAEQVTHRTSIRAALIVIGCGALLLVVGVFALPARSLMGWRNGSVRIDNQHFHQAYAVEILVPTRAGSCAAAADHRLEAVDYCLLRSVQLEPRTHTTVQIPEQPGGCPLVWVRAYAHGDLAHTATFDLPAGIEIEAFGGLDQKGFGHPNMHPAPQGWDAPIQTCTRTP